MDLKSFLTWETPVKITGTRCKFPLVTISRKFSKNKNQEYDYKLTFNSAWTKENIVEFTNKENNLHLSIGFDEENKNIFLIFNPPQKLPSYTCRFVNKEKTTLQLMNLSLLTKIWGFFNMPYVDKQFFQVEKYQEIENKQVWKMSYNPKAIENATLISKTKKPKS